MLAGYDDNDLALDESSEEEEKKEEEEDPDCWMDEPIPCDEHGPSIIYKLEPVDQLPGQDQIFGQPRDFVAEASFE